jgi:hypothetical protein
LPEKLFETHRLVSGKSGIQEMEQVSDAPVISAASQGFLNPGKAADIAAAVSTSHSGIVNFGVLFFMVKPGLAQTF